MRKTFALASAFMSVVLLSPASFASVNDDQVTSQKIKEADGTSGQNTNSGSGVKTNHIQNGAVTDTKITGPISAAKISSAGLNADTVDGIHAAGFAPAAHNHDAVYAKKYANVSVVAKSGGDYDNPASALSSLAQWCASPSATNPCLLKIMPGVYPVTAPIEMRAYVDIQGSGQENTEIKGDIPGGVNLFGPVPASQPATVRLASHSALRDLTVSNYSNLGAIAVFATDTVNAKAERVRAIASGTGGDSGSGGYSYCGFHIIGPLADVTLNEVTAESFSNTVDTGDSVAIGGFAGPRLEVNRSKAVIRNAWYNIGIAGSGAVTGGHNELIVRDTVVESLGDAVESHGNLVEQGFKTSIHGTTVTVDCLLVTDRGCYGVSSDSSNTSIDHSDITLLNSDTGGQLWHMVLRGYGKIASSGLTGTLLSPYGSQDWKITNCWDGNFDTIVNR